MYPRWISRGSITNAIMYALILVSPIPDALGCNSDCPPTQTTNQPNHGRVMAKRHDPQSLQVRCHYMVHRSIRRARSQMIRLVPTKADLEKRVPIVLTQRDRDILVALYVQGFLTAQLIELAFFPEPPGGRRSPCSQAYDRLSRLWAWSYVDRVVRPIARSLGGRQPYLYTLGARGRPIVEQEIESKALVHQRRLARLNSEFVGHDLIIAEFWACLVAMLRSVTVGLVRWRPERELRALKMRVRAQRDDRWLPFLPDASFELRYSNGVVQCGLLEVDMGTLSLPRFQRKIRAFELARAYGLFEKHWGLEDFEVYVLAETEARLDGLARAARAMVAEDGWRSYFFATFEALDPQRLVDGESWRALDGLTYNLLYDFHDREGEDGADAGRDDTPGIGDEIDRGAGDEAE